MPTTSFDPQFLSQQNFPFYVNHPYMLPFVGNNYVSPNHKKLLLVGESHYMPKNSTVHHDINGWYNGAPILTVNEQGYCNTRSTRIYKSGHLGKEIERNLQLIHPVCGNAWEEVAFINYFMRPTDNLQGIEIFWESSPPSDEIYDREFAIHNFIKVVDVLKPDIMVLLSKLICDCVEESDSRKPSFLNFKFWDWSNPRGIEYIYTNHPSCSHWNRPMKKYSKAKGLTSQKFFVDWLEQNW